MLYFMTYRSGKLFEEVSSMRKWHVAVVMLLAALGSWFAVGTQAQAKTYTIATDTTFAPFEFQVKVVNTRELILIF